MQSHWRAVVSLILLAAVGCDQSQPAPVETESGLISQQRQQSPDLAAEPSHNPNAGDAVTSQPPSPGAAEVDAFSAPILKQQTEMNRPFATLQPVTSNSPEVLINHLRDIDNALQDLVQKGAGNFLDETSFVEGGLRLGRMKRDAGLQLASAPESNDEQRRSGVLAQLVALSHMSGLRDVESAKELERFAQQLVASNDEELAHQARVVLLGFELQSLQNGVRADPGALLTQVNGLFARPQDRRFPEFMVLQQAQQVLQQMGFADAAQTVKNIVVEEYRSSPDAQLRGEAWLIETRESEAYQAFLAAFRGLGTEQFDAPAAASAVRELYEAFPTFQTAEQLATAVGNVEYSGEIALSQDMAGVVQQALASLPPAPTSEVVKLLDAHAARLNSLNKPLQLEGLVDFRGQPLDWKQYEGQVVLVSFWASWCIKCMREIPAIQEAYTEFSSQGFDVLGVNMDQELAEGQRAVSSGNFPWKNYHSANPEALGFQAPLAQQLGVNAIPFMILVGRDGSVVALHVRGERLKPAIQKLLDSTN